MEIFAYPVAGKVLVHMHIMLPSYLSRVLNMGISGYCMVSDMSEKVFPGIHFLIDLYTAS